jgi:uncharacterized protein (DUF1499 family)
MIIGTFVLIIGSVLFLLIFSIISRKKPSVGLVNGRLRPCSNRPNCVCSEEKNSPSYIKPITFSGPAKGKWERARQIIREMGGKIVHEEDDYLWATFCTKIFRFVDDLELRMEEESSLIHIRSSSRVGYSDMGVNRRRVEDFRLRFKSMKSSIGI